MSTALTACPECDLLLKPPSTGGGRKNLCPRCGCLQHQQRPHSVERVFALALTGLVLVVPANALPLLMITFLGSRSDSTLLASAAALCTAELWPVALLVFLASILVPIVNIVLALLVSGHLLLHRYHPWLAGWLHAWHHLEEWAMLEVYLLSIIVACVKLSDTVNLYLGWGLYAFVALLVVNVLLLAHFDEQNFWRRVAELSGRGNDTP